MNTKRRRSVRLVIVVFKIEMEVEQMNFFNPKVRKIVSGVVLLIIVAMLATSIIPYLI